MREYDDGEPQRERPYKWAICGRCEGEGKHDHPAFSNGITSDEWNEWDADDRETYLDGGYDVPCTECGGSGKVKEPDVSAMTFAEKRQLVEELRTLAEERADWESERWVRYHESGGHFG